MPNETIILNDTVTQRDREREGLAEGFAQIDGRSFEQLLDFGVRYAGMVKFYGLDNKPVGNWTDFFIANPSVLMASILAVDLTRLGDETDSPRATAAESELAAQIELWRNAVDGMAARDGWSEFRVQMLDAFPSEHCSSELGGSLRHLQDIARLHFPDSLKRDDHAPQLALYMAFCRLFRTAQRTANTIPDRLVEFYYRDVLHFRDRPARADTTFLTFEMPDAADQKRGEIAADTVFSAGRDENGDDVLFGCVSEVEISQTSVDRIRAVRVVDKPLCEAISSFESSFANCHHHHHEPTPTPNPTSDPSPNPSPAPSSLNVPVRSLVVETEKPSGWEDNSTSLMPLFGAGAAQTAAAFSSQNAQFGFAIASQALSLSGGTRTVKIVLEAALDAGEVELAVLANASGQTENEVLENLLLGAFTFSFSTAGGWVDVSRPEVTVSEGPIYVVTFTFALGPDFPPIAGFTMEDGEAVPSQSRAPAVKAEMLQTPVQFTKAVPAFQTFPFAILQDLVLSEAKLHVTVHDLPGVILSNSEGELDPANPFALFGSEPRKDAFLDISNPELFSKRITSLTVDLDWFELPSMTGGFQSYYQYYEIDPAGNPLAPKYDNTVFRCRFDIVQPGKWTFEAQDFQLYSSISGEPPSSFQGTEECKLGTLTADGRLCPSTNFGDFTITSSSASEHYAPDAGALRISLSGPQYGYGAELFTPNVLKSVLAELPDGDETQEEKCAKKCKSEHRVWSEVINELEAGLLLATGKKNGKYFDAIIPSIVAANVELYRSYKACAAVGEHHTDSEQVQKIAHHLDRFNGKLGHSKWTAFRDLDRVHEMLASFVNWRKIVADFIKLEEVLESNCGQYLLAILEIDIALAVTMHENFSHPEKAYPANIAAVILLLAETDGRIQKACCDECMKVKYPLEPYVPWASAIRLGYVTLAAAPIVADTEPLEFSHLLPSGDPGPVTISARSRVRLLPSFDFEGSVAFRLSRPDKGQAQTILFALEGAAGAGGLPEPQWSYLAREGWKSITPDAIAKEGSDGLRQTGILELLLPDTLAVETSVGDEFEHAWIRASVDARADQFPSLRAALANAATAQRLADDKGLLQYAEPIPAGTISAPLDPVAAIKNVFQPLPSFGGKPAEEGFEAKIGFAERLRHKNRAIDCWDYGHLVLANFPSVGAVKVVPASDQSDGRDRTSGTVLVVVVASRQADGVSATKPIVAQSIVSAIQAFLSERASPFARIGVENPPYLELSVNAEIGFQDSSESGRNLDRLNRELVEYLSPNWDDLAEPRASEYWLENEVAGFILSRPYVEEIGSIVLAQERLPEGPIFLTSAPKHNLTQLRAAASVGDDQ